MRKQFNERTNYDNSLKQLDKDIIWNQTSKNQVRNKILLNIDKLERKTKMLKGFKYASSVGVFIVFLLFGYHLLSSNITYNSGKGSTENQSNQMQDNLVIDEEDDQEIINDRDNENKEIPELNRSIVTKEELLKDMDLRLPSYIPNQVNTEPQYIKQEHPDGTELAEVRYMESKSYFFNFAQGESDVSQQATIQRVKNEMYKNEVIEEIEIAGHPSFLLLEGDTSYYSSLHIITDKYFITLTTHGFDKEEILRVANSIDLIGL